ncbi:MAG: hypothetical protein K2M01_07470 [Paramuribaculum sp.]|nr:hypothetical protein [Paramuribaculum sp.]
MKKILILLIAMLGWQLAFAQSSPTVSKVKVGKPSILKPAHGTYKRSDLMQEFAPGSKWGTKATVNEFWKVYSDRNRNQLYADASLTQKLPTMLAFGQPVVIADVKGDAALVYEDPKLERYPIIPSYAKMLGWIPMENLLLWDKCPTDERGVQYKALIAINLNKMAGKEFKGKYYESPTDSREPKDLLMDMNFYFIMKETPDGSRVLLCRNPSIFGNNLYGWVDDNAFSRWDQRACIEPNWDPQYVDNHKGQMVGIYGDENLTAGNKVTNWEFGSSNGDKDRWNTYRMVPEQLRFPIVERVKENANWIHCTSFANKQGGKANYDSDSRSVTGDVDRVRQMRGQMNVIVVAEATTDMQDILPAIKNSIDKCKSFGGQGLKVKVGAVLYRGSDQGDNGIEIVPLTNYDDQLLLSKFSSAKANGKLSGSVRDVALGKAINKASDPSLMGFNKDQNNLIVVVGSRGAPQNDSNIDNPEIKRRLLDNNVQVMSIQVMRNQSGTWVDFNDQMRDIILNNVNAQYAAIGDRADFKQRQQGDGYNFYSGKNSDDRNKSVLFAQIRYGKDLGKALTPSEVSKYLENGINKFAETTSTWNEHFEESLGNIQFDPSFLERYLGKSGYQKWQKIKAISAFDGYAIKKDGNGNSYWHYVLYLSDDELRKLLDDLKPAYLAAKAQSDDRKPYIDAMRAIVKAHLGQSDDKSIDSMDADQLQELIYGLDVHTDMTNRRRLKDIQDPRTVTPIEFRKMTDKFSKNYEKLQSIQNDGYTYRVKMGQNYYYWIPIEDLP